MDFENLDFGFCVRDMVFGVWNFLSLGIQVFDSFLDLEFGVWDLEFWSL